MNMTWKLPIFFSHLSLHNVICTSKNSYSRLIINYVYVYNNHQHNYKLNDKIIEIAFNMTQMLLTNF